MITIPNILELIMILLAGSILVIYFQRKEVNNDLMVLCKRSSKLRRMDSYRMV